MAFEFKKLSDVEVVENPIDSANVLIEEDGVIKKAPKIAVGGSGDVLIITYGSDYNYHTNIPYEKLRENFLNKIWFNGMIYYEATEWSGPRYYLLSKVELVEEEEYIACYFTDDAEIPYGIYKDGRVEIMGGNG